MSVRDNLPLKIVNLFMFLGTIVSNYFTIGVSNVPNSPFKPIGNISNQYDTLLTPPGWTFSIWGIIYTGLLLFSICQFIPQLGLGKQVKDIGIFFILSCVFNIAWIFTFSVGTPVSILVSVFIIFGLLTSLIFIQERVGFFSSDSSVYKILFVDIPFSIYLGWVITASILNVSTTITAYGALQESGPVFYIIMLIVALIIYTLLLGLRNNYGSYVVFFYVLIALCIKHKDDGMLLGTTVTVLVFAVLFLLLKVFLPKCRRLNGRIMRIS